MGVFAPLDLQRPLSRGDSGADPGNLVGRGEKQLGMRARKNSGEDPRRGRGIRDCLWSAHTDAQSKRARSGATLDPCARFSREKVMAIRAKRKKTQPCGETAPPTTPTEVFFCSIVFPQQNLLLHVKFLPGQGDSTFQGCFLN